jgi:hypothetical protein
MFPWHFERTFMKARVNSPRLTFRTGRTKCSFRMHVCKRSCVHSRTKVPHKYPLTAATTQYVNVILVAYAPI